MNWLLLLAVLLGGLGLWLLVRSRATRHASGLPVGRVAYADTGAWDRCERPLFSRQYRLTGRPDYVVRLRSGIVPVEVKSGRAPGQPYPGHILQLAAYCLLLEELDGQVPPYGILKYDDQTFEVDNTPELRARLLGILDDIRRGLQTREVDRSHDEAARCRGCGHRDRCGQQLV
jgi:CRISPR-associated exonuclease Cas4